jgi:putative membrane protein
MLITQNLSLYRFLKTTMRVDIFLIVTCTITYFLHKYVILQAVQIPPTIATLLGTALAFFVGFNNNQAYNRWWEARTIWGALVNDSRSWARNMISYVTPGNLGQSTVHTTVQSMVRRQLAFTYSLKEVLRKKTDGYFERFLSKEELEKVKLESNIPNAILTLNARDLQRLFSGKSIDEFRLSQMNELLTSFTDHMGKSERIRNTIFPTSYIYFTRLFIWVLVAVVTLTMADTIGPWSILLGWVIGFVFQVTHQNGMVLMDPFDELPTGIPLNQISRTIEINLLEMLDEKQIPEPVKPVNNEYVL